MKLIDLLKSLATKSKLDLTKPEFVSVLEASKDIEVPQTFADQLESSLMTEDAAFNNQKVRGRVHAEIFDGEDLYLNTILPDLDIEDQAKDLIKGEKSTREKIHKTIASLNEAKKRAKKSGDTVTEEALKQQVADLNKQLKSIKDSHTAELSKVQGERDNDFINFELMTALGAKQYALPESMPAKQKLKTALLIIQDEIARKNLKVVKKDNGIKLIKADGTDAYDERNTLLELPSFIDGALAQNGLLKNSDSSKSENDQKNSQFDTRSNGQGQVVNTQFLSEIDKSINSLIN